MNISRRFARSNRLHLRHRLTSFAGAPCACVGRFCAARFPALRTTPTDSTEFADGFPVLLATEASLADLNTRLSSLVPMNQFLTNVVVSGDFPVWVEDG